MLDFYQTMLNIKKWDTNQVITILNKMIKKEMEDINNYEELCNNLYIDLSEIGFNLNKINISDIYKDLKEYVFLILSYQDLNSKFNYILIDPTYNHFCKKKGKESPFYYEAWPGEMLMNINPNFYNTLLEEKYCYVDDKSIKDYFRSFTNRNVDINLETLILNKYERNKTR